MICPNCHSSISDDSTFCSKCGTAVERQVQYHQPQQQVVVQQVPTIPTNYEPISAWGYFGYQILFAIPILGFIFLVVFALSNENINRRNFARSYFCVLVIIVIICIIFGTALAGLFEDFSQNYM